MAALLVVITHSTFYASERLDPDLFVWKGGTVGVDIFFVISGFVMMITAPPFQKVSGGWRYFAMRRVTRIVPMYWIATTAKIAMILILPGAAINSALTPGHVISSYLFLPTRNESGSVEPVLGVGWTLTFEMFFYAVFAVGLLLRANPYIFATIIMCLAAAGHLLRGDGDWPVWAFYFDKVVLYFVIGMTIAKIVSSNRLRRFVPYMLGGLVAIAGVLIILGQLDWSRNAWLRTVVVTFIVLAAVASDRLLTGRIPRPVLFFGDASYSLYLFHPLLAPLVPAILALIGLEVGWLSVIGSITAALVGSALIYVWVEKPITRGARKLPFAGRLPQPSKVPAAAA
ncbi:acyltransferase family protein [Microbacterium pygmaeum]|uniref:Peptidoglycan/LPS O-acetylase OafA/YrhL, contains acyltransferase and SGNH-hydrolase domains n=1 Tax=Microbacterium pygmaeum TaxID=370764 RepID=A0A1G7TCZ1_9MICO|nr:acyltransferase [Microbacterium pygmaeum]SDG32894.1 Peptidoglycan/LPS O-acetylase OafA/YrhL, contains acyltransferase and SGNH-hydrolase domains [Microbacterium pygmaeum]